MAVTNPSAIPVFSFGATFATAPKATDIPALASAIPTKICPIISVAGFKKPAIRSKPSI